MPSIIRTERAEVLWAAESTFGSIAPAPYARFGIHDTIEAPDPEFAWEPHFGVFSGRDRATIMRGQATLRGTLPDVRIQSGLTTFMQNHVLRPAPGYNEMVAPFTLFVGYRDTGGTRQLERYYTGGKVNRATISIAEGQELRMSVDEMLFRRMYTHRNGNNDPYSASNPAVDPGYSAYGRFMFAHGAVSIGGVTYDRIRRFSLTVDNQIEPRYYIQRDSTTGLFLPNDLIEGRRVWRAEVELDVVDTADLELWDFLVNQGASASGRAGMTAGARVVLSFNQSGTGLGSSTMTLTCGGSPSVAQPSGVITAAPHSIPAPPAGVVTVTAAFDINTVTIA